MALLLYRLGKFSFRRHWWVISAWALIVVLVGGSALLFHGQTSNSFQIPGTETQQVADKLKAELPTSAGGSGSVVFASANGQPFTQAQKNAVSAALKKSASIQDVRGVTDPFNTQAAIDGASAKITDGEQKLAAAQAKLDAAKPQLDAAAAQLQSAADKLDASQAQLNQQTTDAAASGKGISAAQQARLAGAQAQIDAGRQQLATGQATYDKNKKAYDDGLAELAQQSATLALSKRAATASLAIRFVSENGQAAIAQIQFTGSIDSISPEAREQVKDAVQLAATSGVLVYPSKEITQDVSEIFGTAEVIGIAMAAAVLILMLGTLVAAGLPLIMAIIGVGVGVGGGFALSGVIEMSSISPILALMLGLAVGIDYSLFIVNRHRQQLLAGMSMEESVAKATGTSGNAVLFAGLTVVIALSALTVSGLPFLGVMGVAAAATVAIAVLVALTLTPAMLGLIGTKLISKRAWTKAQAQQKKTTAADAAVADNAKSGKGWGGFVTRHPVATLVTAVVALGIIAVPAAGLRLALPDGGSEPVDSSAYQAYHLTGTNFGEGVNGPIIAVGSLPAGRSATAAQALELKVADELRTVPNVVAAVPAALSDNRQTAVFQVIPTEGPASASTVQVIADLRAKGAQITKDTGVTIGLTGQTAANVDVSTKLGNALPLYLVIVVGLSLVLLLLVFRSILVPILATAGFLLSLAAAFGGVVAVYQWGWLSAIFDVPNPGAVLSFLPIILIGVLFGLAMDYQVFIVSGMREAYVHGQDARAAVRTGFSHAARVVVAAAIIMTSVFAGFIFSHLTMVRPLGFAMAFGVLLDAFVVRMTIIPAAMHLLGKTAWWVPGWLDHILPDVDVEGAKLERPSGGRHAAATAPDARGADHAGHSGPDASHQPRHSNHSGHPANAYNDAYPGGSGDSASSSGSVNSSGSSGSGETRNGSEKARKPGQDTDDAGNPADDAKGKLVEADS
ncbi:MMPL family transporter [Paenarthrobacter sp. Z7-10]|uniref:MMPL family transporter n=1 Tax=Paenarthrobacter sp. Z7-10 TaxID=2787635 RepID=UPI0022A8E5E3|nr:MMPL family transporter [Paenarthrobacter sp. Z7-10]MCZ2402914.1 MMPL family transporter [Paenarthrobacter sp. Z7-10]